MMHKHKKNGTPKIFLDIDEQIKYLREKKLICVDLNEYEFFQERNYSSIINPYKEFFSSGRNDQNIHIYQNETAFRDFIDLIKIDDIYSRHLYTLINSFERKFKSVLFYEICNRYKENGDIHCTSYVNEISEFLNVKYPKILNYFANMIFPTRNDNKLPKFCSNFYYQLSKEKYIRDKYGLLRKEEVLKKIYQIGLGKYETKSNRINQLIHHHIKAQGIAPLWVLPNALSLGDLQTIFTLLDSNTQKKVVSYFLKSDNYQEIPISKIHKFSGKLETIRKIRNTINHYEPIFPLFFSFIKDLKKYKNSHLIQVLDFLENNHNSSFISRHFLSDITPKLTNFNTKHIYVLNKMKDSINKKNKSEPFDSLV